MTLASAVREGPIAEIGTGAGVGTAWLYSGFEISERPESEKVSPSIFTFEPNQQLALAAKAIFMDYPSIEVLQQDWLPAIHRQPFALLFADGGNYAADQVQWLALANLLRPGGTLVIDDVTPEALWPEQWLGKPDPKRELAFNSGYFQSTEVMMTANTSVLIAVKL